MEEAVNGNDLAWLFQEAVLNLKRNANEVLARLLLAIHHRFAYIFTFTQFSSSLV